MSEFLQPARPLGRAHPRTKESNNMTIDINTILAAALSQAIAEQLAPLEQRITAQASLITALTQSVAALMTQLDERIEAALSEALADSTLIKRAAKAALSEHEEDYNHDAFVSDISDALNEIHVEDFINVERLLARTELTATINFQPDLDD
jgi:hypothetical protein